MNHHLVPRPARIVAAHVAFVCAVPALAQPAPTPALLDPVVVTAARAPQRLEELLADVTVIGPDEIARAGAQSLADLLQRQPGVQIVANGGPGSTTGVFLRSANANQTLVLIDGLRVGASSSGTTPFEAIPLDQIDHIEILRGPAASLYGADAIGGVIQIFTRNGGSGALAANASAGYGTFGTSQVTAGAGGSDGPWRFSLAGRVQPKRGLQRDRQSRQLQLQRRPRRLRQRQRERRPRLHLRARAGGRGAGLLQPHERPVRRRHGFRRSHHHDRAKLLVGQSKPPGVVLEKHARSGRVDRRQQDRSRFRHFRIQDDTAPVPLAERLRIAGCRMVSRQCAVGGVFATRGAPRHRRRLPGDVARHQRGRRRVQVAGWTATRCSSTCGATTARSTEARPRAAPPTPTRLRRACARARATVPASRRRPSTTSISPTSPTRTWCPRPRTTSRSPCATRPQGSMPASSPTATACVSSSCSGATRTSTALRRISPARRSTG